LIYLVRKNIEISNNSLFLSEKDIHYLFNVRRFEDDETLFLFSNQTLYEATLTEKNKKRALFHIKREQYIPEPLFKISIAIPFTDSTSVEEAVRNSVEAGIYNSFFNRAERSNLKKDFFERKKERFNDIIESAASQSRRRCLPEIFIKSAEEIIKLSGRHLIVHPYQAQSIETVNTQAGENWIVWLGPEGGFSDSEIAFFKNSTALFAKFNTPILRMENAATLAVGIMRNKVPFEGDLFMPE